jgi:hypothetical protein
MHGENAGDVPAEQLPPCEKSRVLSAFPRAPASRGGPSVGAVPRTAALELARWNGLTDPCKRLQERRPQQLISRKVTC